LADWNGHGFAQSVSARAVGTCSGHVMRPRLPRYSLCDVKLSDTGNRPDPGVKERAIATATKGYGYVHLFAAGRFPSFSDMDLAANRIRLPSPFHRIWHKPHQYIQKRRPPRPIQIRADTEDVNVSVILHNVTLRSQLPGRRLYLP
jgi:hypothetical protein